MNKFILSMLCSTLLLACGKHNAEQNVASATASAVSASSTTTSLSTYKVTSYPYTPFVIRDDKGVVSGFETEILQAIAENQHIQFEFIPMLSDWELLFKSIENKQADLLSAAMYPNPERRNRFEVSQPYMPTQFVLLSRKGIKIQNLSDLKGKKLAVFKNSMAEREIRALPYANEIKIEPINSIYSGVKLVVSGKADVIYGDQVVLTYYANQFQDQGLSIYADPNAEKHQFVFLITKGNTDLLNKVNAGLAAIQANGTLDAIKQKWLGKSN